MKRIIIVMMAVVFALAAAGCSSPSESQPVPSDTGGSDANSADTDNTDTGADADVRAEDRRSATVTHRFPERMLAAGSEDVVCVQWSLGNEEALYVNSVTLGNDGGFHHSNWYIVPEDHFPGEDGYFECGDRNWSQDDAALSGGVLFAQSTQARSETQRFPEGVTVKIPPNFKIISDVHLLNVSPRDLEANMRLELGVLHPADVVNIATPFRLGYGDLDIPPKTESRFTGECTMRNAYETITDESFDDLELYYILPHYHGLGNYFSLEFLGGERDGEQIFELEGFNAEANGQSFSPPINMNGADGFRFSCGYDNPRDESVGWGIGDQEMCLMLGFTSGTAIFSGSIQETDAVDSDGEVVHKSGPCSRQIVPRSRAQSMPTDEEQEAPLYVPDTDPDDDVDVVPDCVDTPAGATADIDPTLTNLSDHIFGVSCSFSACHGSQGSAAGLELDSETLHSELMNHEPYWDTDLPLVAPGDAQGSWLYQMVSKCEPQTNSGVARPMPLSSPTLLDDHLVAALRDWIDNGAMDN